MVEGTCVYRDQGPGGPWRLADLDRALYAAWEAERERLNSNYDVPARRWGGEIDDPLENDVPF
jgi:hypothetical protein